MERLFLSTLIGIHTSERDLLQLLNQGGRKVINFTSGLTFEITPYNRSTFRVVVHKQQLYRKVYMVAPSELNLYLQREPMQTHC